MAELEGFNATAAISDGMADGSATSDNSAPAPAAPAVEEGEQPAAVGEGEQAVSKSEADKGTADKAVAQPIGDIDISKVDLSKLSPEVRTLVDGYRKSFQADYTRKMQALKEKEESLQPTKGQPKPEAPKFDDSTLEQLQGDLTEQPLKQLAAMNRYHEAQISEMQARLDEAHTLANKMTEMYLDDKFAAQYDQLTGKGGEYESTPLDRAVVMEIIKNSTDDRLGLGPEMVRNAFRMILGDAHAQKAEAAKAAQKAAKHALPASGGIAGRAMSKIDEFKADLVQRLGKYKSPERTRGVVNVNL